ncbi:hypothetical protein [Thermomonospora amylolytica]|uniref:hypothetical protein n=1 Tax=Thermomonospora amylolytica TaxID=1411117 RepID=UPI000E6B97FA|nr:hypothetical protein [Thermomonospora amylolytica]
MGFDQERFAAANVAGAFGPRRLYLAALDAVFVARRGLGCGVVVREGGPVLRVVAEGAAGRAVEVGCDFLDGRWWFTWADSGRTIGVVEDPRAVADEVVRVLRVEAAR